MHPGRRRVALAALAALGLAAAGRRVRAQQAPAAEALQLYLLIGQSNMAGRGTPEAEDRVADPRVLALDAAGHWREAIEPLHFDKPAVAGVGPGRAFGIAMAGHAPGVRVGLVPCAVGGTKLALWQPGARHADTGSHPWDDTARRIATAAPAGRWCGVLFHQGESDSNEADAPHYAARLQALLVRVRAALGDARLPVVLGQMGRWPERPWTAATQAVDAAQQALVRTLPRLAFVTAEGLQHRGDALHFDAASARTLGRRYAAAMQALQSTEPGREPAPR